MLLDKLDSPRPEDVQVCVHCIVKLFQHFFFFNFFTFMYVVSYVEEWLMFILQLSALYEVKPPISKAKMTSITRGAIKAIKFYKHVVQSVEKFIQKVKYVAVTCFCDIFLLHLSSL